MKKAELHKEMAKAGWPMLHGNSSEIMPIWNGSHCDENTPGHVCDFAGCGCQFRFKRRAEYFAKISETEYENLFLEYMDRKKGGAIEIN